MGYSDSLDVSLHDHDLGEEVELVAQLIVAANESEGALSVDELDELLGVPRQRKPQPAMGSPARQAPETKAAPT